MFMSGSCSRSGFSDEPLASTELVKRPRVGGFVHKPLDEKRKYRIRSRQKLDEFNRQIVGPSEVIHEFQQA